MAPSWRYPFAGMNPTTVTAGLTAVAYAVVLGTFAGIMPGYPELTRETVDLLSHLTAVANLVTILAIALGWYWIKQRQIRKHAGAMAVATISILAFLLMYLTRIGGGGQKALAGEPHLLLEWAYLGMLAVHILLSILAVPLVIFALVLALSVPTDRLASTRHPQIGRIAAVTWLVSLALGIGAYLVLNHLVGAELVS